jgi:hypothetical protein
LVVQAEGGAFRYSIEEHAATYREMELEAVGCRVQHGRAGFGSAEECKGSTVKVGDVLLKVQAGCSQRHDPKAWTRTASPARFTMESADTASQATCREEVIEV